MGLCQGTSQEKHEKFAKESPEIHVMIESKEPDGSQQASVFLHYKNSAKVSIVSNMLSKRRENDHRLNPTIHYLHQNEQMNMEVLKAENWAENHPNLDAHKFLIIYSHYAEDREIFLKTWPSEVVKLAQPLDPDRGHDSCLCPELKFHIRKGIPIHLSRPVFLKIFGINEHFCDTNYFTTLETVFKGKVPSKFRNCPTFSNDKNIQEVLLFDMLNEEGKNALQRILWLIEKTYVGLKYCPLLPIIAALLLSIFKESETFQILTTMLDTSEKLLDENSSEGGLGARCLRWYFPMNEDILRKVCHTFIHSIAKKSSDFQSVLNHLEEIHFDAQKLFFSWFSTMFQGYVNQDFIFRILFCFLNEGIKVFYRFGYALIHNLRKMLKIISTGEEVDEYLLSFCHNIGIKEREEIIKNAFKLSFNMVFQKFSDVKVLKKCKSLKVHKIYRPHIHESSRIVHDSMFELFYSYLPSSFRICNPELKYASWRDGFGIKNAVSKNSKYDKEKEIGVLLLIKTSKNEEFGAFFDCPFDYSNKFLGSHYSFVFQLKPFEAIYESCYSNTSYLMLSKEKMVVGDGCYGPAIELDHEFNRGKTCSCDTFGSPPLIEPEEKAADSERVDFNVIAIELFVLQ